MRYHCPPLILFYTSLCLISIGCRAAQRQDGSYYPERVPVLRVSQTKEQHPVANAPLAPATTAPPKEAPSDSESPVLTQQEWITCHHGLLTSDGDGTVTIDLANQQVTDTDLASLPDKPSIRQLDLSHTAVTDQGLEHLGKHIELRVLKLEGVRLTDQGIHSLAQLPNIELLGLSKTAVTDTGLKDLAAIPSIRFLLLDHTQITDAGLEHIKSMEQLEGLSLMQTHVTAKAVEKLQFDLPACSIIHKEVQAVKASDSSSAWNEPLGPTLEGSNQMIEQATPNLFPATNATSLETSELTPLVQLPVIRPRHNGPGPQRAWMGHQQSSPVPQSNPNGWLGAEQSGSPAQAVARVGFTTPPRQASK